AALRLLQDPEELAAVIGQPQGQGTPAPARLLHRVHTTLPPMFWQLERLCHGQTRVTVPAAKATRYGDAIVSHAASSSQAIPSQLAASTSTVTLASGRPVRGSSVSEVSRFVRCHPRREVT